MSNRAPSPSLWVVPLPLHQTSSSRLFALQKEGDTDALRILKGRLATRKRFARFRFRRGGAK